MGPRRAQVVHSEVDRKTTNLLQQHLSNCDGGESGLSLTCCVATSCVPDQLGKKYDTRSSNLSTFRVLEKGVGYDWDAKPIQGIVASRKCILIATS